MGQAGRLALLLLLTGVVALRAGDQNAECARCHRAETELHNRTRMANAMLPASASAFAANAPAQGLHEPSGGYAFFFSPSPGGLSVVADRDGNRAQGVIEWVLGAGSQGQTPLIKTQSGTLESHLSYFPQARQFGFTIGQSGGPSANALAALGRLQSPSELRTCVGCHATAVTSDSEPVIPGVQCVRCHAGAEEHAKGHGMPVNPGKLAAAEQVRLCGTCHRSAVPAGEDAIETIRFQPFRLQKSPCFRSGKLACTTCHVAHQDARRDDHAFYNSKCATCHGASEPAHSDARQTGDCVSCHMPRVSVHPALAFTDHYIRIVKGS